MENLKNFIFLRLDEKGYILDSEVAKFCKKEPNFSTVEEYKRQWRKLQNDKQFFSDKKIIKADKHGRRHYVQTTVGMYQCGKDYFKKLSTSVDK